MLQFCIIFAYYFAPHAHATTNFSAANSNQYLSAFTKPKALSYFYHHTTPRSPTLQKKSSLPPQAVAHHTPTSQPQQLLAAIHISWAQWEPCSLLVLCSSHFAPSHVELFFCKKRLVLGYENQTYSRCRINLTPPPSWMLHLIHSILRYVVQSTTHLSLNVLWLLFRQNASITA